MKILLADEVRVNIPKPKQEKDNNHNNAPCNLQRRESNCLNPKRYVISMIGVG